MEELFARNVMSIPVTVVNGEWIVGFGASERERLSSLLAQ
jgi:hypothetical protein